MHGTIHFESAVGVGTTARVTLPLKLFHVSSIQKDGGPITSSPAFPSYPSGPPRVRVISDELTAMLDPGNIIEEAAIADIAAAHRLLEPETFPVKPVVELPVDCSKLLDYIPRMANAGKVKVTALVVDDNAISRFVFFRLLDSARYRLLT